MVGSLLADGMLKLGIQMVVSFPNDLLSGGSDVAASIPRIVATCETIPMKTRTPYSTYLPVPLCIRTAPYMLSHKVAETHESSLNFEIKGNSPDRLGITTSE